jgi:hypothetical protein
VFGSEVVLVMILLQAMKIASVALGGIDVVEGVVHNVVGHVAYQEERPEGGEYNPVLNVEDSQDGVVTDCYVCQRKDGGKYEAVTDLEEEYGSIGSMWWMPCSMKCRKRAIFISGILSSQ